MPAKKQTADVAAIPTEDGHAIIGGRPATSEFYDDVTRQQSGMVPRGARNVPVAAIPEAALLPSLAVARNVLGKEIDRLRREVDGLERSIAAHPARFVGNGNPYIQDVMRAHDAMTTGYKLQLEVVRDELARLESLDGQAVQVWAAEFMKTHPVRLH